MKLDPKTLDQNQKKEALSNTRALQTYLVYEPASLSRKSLQQLTINAAAEAFGYTPQSMFDSMGYYMPLEKILIEILQESGITIRYDSTD